VVHRELRRKGVAPDVAEAALAEEFAPEREVAAAAAKAVSIGPGEIESARMPWVANSRATPMVMVTTAPLAAA